LRKKKNEKWVVKRDASKKTALIVGVPPEALKGKMGLAVTKKRTRTATNKIVK